MIELTPLDVRKKRGDFRRAMRGFDPAEVDSFIELVAERMESLVKENMTLKERAARLQDQVREQGGREKAVQDALVTAQELRKDISGQAQREAELMKREAEAEIERMLLDAEHRAEELRTSAAELERRRHRFLRSYRQYLERELDDVDREAAHHPLEDKPLELEFGTGSMADAGAKPLTNATANATASPAANGQADALVAVAVDVAARGRSPEETAAAPEAPVADVVEDVVTVEVEAVVDEWRPVLPEEGIESLGASPARPITEAATAPVQPATEPVIEPVTEPPIASPSEVSRPPAPAPFEEAIVMDPVVVETDAALHVDDASDAPAGEVVAGPRFADDEAVAVESLAPESEEGSEEEIESWTVEPRMRTEVGSDRSGDPDGL